MRRYFVLFVSAVVLSGCARLEAEPEKERPKEDAPFMGVFYSRGQARAAEPGADAVAEGGNENLQPFTP